LVAPEFIAPVAAKQTSTLLVHSGRESILEALLTNKLTG